MTKQIAQGDLLFIKVSDDAGVGWCGEMRPEERDERLVHVIALGEKTGHAHIVEATDTRFFGDRLVVESPVTVIEHVIRPNESPTHKHGDAILGRGVWEIRRQHAWKQAVAD